MALVVAQRRRDASPLPREPWLDSTVHFLREGYRFMPSRFERHGSDAFRTRLSLQKVTCIGGEAAAREFYVPGRFTRRRAIPHTTLMLLQDRGSVQTLDGEAHRHRKALFLALMDAHRVADLVSAFEREWHRRTASWHGREVVLHDEVREMLTAAVCAWAGVRLRPQDVARRAREFGAMIDGAGAVGPRALRGLLLRSRTERWLRGIVRAIREVGAPSRTGATPAEIVAFHRDESGLRLPVKIAAVELNNLLRPTVAVARFVVFAAHALHRAPDARLRIASGDEGYLRWFVQEVRRFYPFFPAVGGRVRETFEWRGHRFAPGDWVMLDIYGTNHDRRTWTDPEDFRPERFAEWNGSPHNFIPQGGGDHERNHRCPGEGATLELMRSAVRLLARLPFELPPQDLRIRLNEMPALPASGFVLAVPPKGGQAPFRPATEVGQAPFREGGQAPLSGVGSQVTGKA